MSLQLPSEIVVERFLPTVRAELAAALADRGLTQAEIAARLGVTQAAVSKYLRGEGTRDPRILEDDRTEATVEHIADGLADDSMTEYEALAELLDLVRAFEDRGPICAIHEEEMPALQGLGCDLCVRGGDAALSTERAVLSNVREATRVLREPAVADYVPNVGTNVGMALPDAERVTDVAAVPGRIIAIRGRVEVPSNPEFGASEHVARAILAARAVDPGIRGAVNVATDDRLLAAARDRGIDPLEFDAGYEDREERLVAAFEERGEVPRVVFHRGAHGIEPVTYVFGESAVDAAQRVVDLVAATDEA